MRLSRIPLSAIALRGEGSVLERAGQLTPITPRSFAMNPLLWMAFLRIHDVIRDELGEYFTEVYLPSPSEVSKGYFSPGSTPTEEEIAVKYIQETMPGTMDFPNSFFYFKKKLLDSAPSGVSIPSNVADQMVIYSFSPNSEDMYNQGKRMKEFFNKISSRIGLSIIFVSGIKFSELSNETIMSLYPDGDESLLYYPDKQCWTDENVLLLERELFSFNNEDEILRNSEIKTGLKHKALQVGEFTYWGRVKTRFKRFRFNSTHSKYYVGKYVLDLTRAMDAIIYHNTGDSGFVWPYEIAPYQLHMICSPNRKDKAEYIYDELRRKQISVLFDDRDIPFDQKFEYARILGIPKVIVINDDTNRTDGGVFLVNRETWEQDYTNYVEILKSPDGLKK